MYQTVTPCPNVVLKMLKLIILRIVRSSLLLQFIACISILQNVDFLIIFFQQNFLLAQVLAFITVCLPVGGTDRKVYFATRTIRCLGWCIG